MEYIIIIIIIIIAVNNAVLTFIVFVACFSLWVVLDRGTLYYYPERGWWRAFGFGFWIRNRHDVFFICRLCSTAR
jgi:hypothetical protein